uniref:conjugal transfer protein TraN n=1 Tax=Escherichia coli TaxID=562 RepID=UPI001BEF216B|nr:IncF plasmid conjugative transfer protein TraN [Escherichia coli]
MKAAAGYSNCCKDSGWGQDIGWPNAAVMKSPAKAKSNKLTVSVGEFCRRKCWVSVWRKTQLLSV